MAAKNVYVSREFDDFVSTVHATYGRELYEVDRKTVVTAWNAVVGDIPVDVLRTKFTELATISKVMPTPGGLRRHVFAEQMSVILTPPEAWAQLQALRVSVNSGTQKPMLDTTVVETIQRLGDTALGLTTNGDREYFFEVYRDVYQKKLIELLKVKV